jgi:hypothetical protein
MARFSPSCGESATLGALLPRLHILTVQGHPEFTDGIIEALVQMRLKSGVLKEGDVEQARARMGWKNEGVDVVGRAIWGVFGVNGCS